MTAMKTQYYPAIRIAAGADRKQVYHLLRKCAEGLEILVALVIVYGLSKAITLGLVKPILPVVILATCVCFLGAALLYLLKRIGRRESPQS